MKNKIKELVQFARTRKNAINRYVEIDKVTDKEAALIKLKTELDVKGYTHIIDKSAINHTLKHHGNDKQEKLRGQIAVTENDFLLIPEILKSENIIYTGKSKLGKDCILYQMESDNI